MGAFAIPGEIFPEIKSISWVFRGDLSLKIVQLIGKIIHNDVLLACRKPGLNVYCK